MELLEPQAQDRLGMPSGDLLHRLTWNGIWNCPLGKASGGIPNPGNLRIVPARAGAQVESIIHLRWAR